MFFAIFSLLVFVSILFVFPFPFFFSRGGSGERTMEETQIQNDPKKAPKNAKNAKTTNNTQKGAQSNFGQYVSVSGVQKGVSHFSHFSRRFSRFCQHSAFGVCDRNWQKKKAIFCTKLGTAPGECVVFGIVRNLGVKSVLVTTWRSSHQTKYFLFWSNRTSEYSMFFFFQAWEVKLQKEGAQDAGGPYRETITQFCAGILFWCFFPFVFCFRFFFRSFIRFRFRLAPLFFYMQTCLKSSEVFLPSKMPKRRMKHCPNAKEEVEFNQDAKSSEFAYFFFLCLSFYFHSYFLLFGSLTFFRYSVKRVGNIYSLPKCQRELFFLFLYLSFFSFIFFRYSVKRVEIVYSLPKRKRRSWI